MASILNATTTSGLVTSADNSGSLQLQTNNGTAALSISTGQQLQVHTAGTASAPVISKSDDTNTGIFFPAADTIAFTEGGVESMRIDSSGNVGIGTSSPAAKLNVVGGNIRLDNNQGVEWGGANNYIYGNETTDIVVVATNGNERMRITSGGDLLVGTSSALSNAAKVQISGGSGSTITSETTGTGATDHVNFRNGNGKVGTITTNGSATSYNTSSDYRLKENIAPMSGALNIVSALKPCTYTWKADGSAGQGFIAHELQAVVPDAVVGDKDAVDEEGKPIYQGVDTSFLVATLTAAIQEQQAQIEELKADLQALKGVA